jgi:outer membrane protein OmpA-like peptidoglycan-associated protein
MNKTQAIVFFGIILIGLGISVFTLNRCGKPMEVVETEEGIESRTAKGEPAQPPVPAPAPVPKAPPAPPTPAPAPSPVAAAGAFKTPDALMGALVETIRKRDLEGFLALTGPDTIAPAIKPQVENLLKSTEWSPAADKPMTELAKMPDSVRWAIHFEPKAGIAVAPSAGQSADLYADLGSNPEKSSWFVKKVALPVDFAAKPAPTQPGVGVGVPAPAPVRAIDATDALTVAHTFSQALIKRDFEVARQMTDPAKVTDERVAALMIAIEEGAFHLREDKPLVVTLARNDLTWVLTRVNSEATASEFAMDLAKPAGSEDWKVQGLTFSKLIAALADQAGAGGVAYAPIMADPQGGDSLVLYFEFDADKLSSRTERQLRIVADILKKDSARKIEINGHADAKGTDGYNEVLSDRRTAAIRAQLLAFGVAPQQVVTKAYGEAQPRRPNFNPDGTDNPDNRSQNRRAEVYLDF